MYGKLCVIMLAIIASSVLIAGAADFNLHLGPYTASFSLPGEASRWTITPVEHNITETYSGLEVESWQSFIKDSSTGGIALVGVQTIPAPQAFQSPMDMTFTQMNDYVANGYFYQQNTNRNIDGTQGKLIIAKQLLGHEYQYTMIYNTQFAANTQVLVMSCLPWDGYTTELLDTIHMQRSNPR